MGKHLVGLLAAALLSLPAGAEQIALLQNGFSIRFARSERVGNLVRLYLDSVSNSGYVDVPADQISGVEPDGTPSPEVSAAPAQSQDVHQVVAAASNQASIDPDLIESVIRAESGFNPKAISRKGAQGLMQLMPATASKLGVTNSMDPAANVDGGTQYLREMLARFNNDLVKALAAYNAGPARVEKYKGVPPYHETYAYVSRIISDFNRKKLAQFAAAQPAKHRTAKEKEKTSHPAVTADHSTAAEAQAAPD